MGSVEGFCYFCFKRVVHGPAAGNLLQYCLRALFWDFVMALIMIIQRLFTENVLRLIDYITFVTCFHSRYCYFACSCHFNLFILFN